MSLDPDAASHQPEESSAEEEEKYYQKLPMYLVSGDEMEDLLHPEVAITRRADAPPDDPGIESIIFRQEDYSEPGDENWAYGGLVHLEPAEFEYDDDITPEELAAAIAAEPETWDYPESVTCPGCSSQAEWMDGPTGEDTCVYICGECCRMMLLERRASLRNAAVLLVSRVANTEE